MRQKLICSLLSFGLASAVAFAQNRTSFNGVRNAYDYAYGINANAAPLRIDVGNTATGAQTVTVALGTIVLSDGNKVAPLSTTAPVVVGIGANAETVTPSAVSCSTPDAYDTCTFTATFSNLHGTSEPVSSGTYGVEEAVNAAHTMGGLVAVTGAWANAGGVTATITGNKGWTNVTVLDYRGTSGAVSYKAASNGANMAATTNVLY